MYQKEAFLNPDPRRSVLQIPHDFQFVALNLPPHLYEFPEGTPDAARREHIKYRLDRMKDRGYAGVVVNADWKNYLEDEEALQRLAWTIDYADSLGLRIWIYDEQYYPTGAAGNLTLRDHPEHNNMCLVCVEKDVTVKHNSGPIRIMSPYGHSGIKYAFAADEAGNRQEVSQWTDPAGNLCWDAPQGKWHLWCFFLRPFYEHALYSQHIRAARRYVNVGDEAAIKRFLEVTYGTYERALGIERMKKVETVFTDEPSYLWHHTYPEGFDPDNNPTTYHSISVTDRPDLEVPDYPFFPWARGIEEAFEKHAGYSLIPHLPELYSHNFEGTGALRRAFAETLGIMFDHAYNDQFLETFAKYGIQYAGHHICEESIEMHPFIYGNFLHNLGRMDIPGCDLLYSAPDRTRHTMAGKFASSAAHHYGKKHTMIEASNMCDEPSAFVNKGGDYDWHSEKDENRFEWDGEGFSVKDIELAMAMLHAMGVDKITSYYGEELFSEEGYKRYLRYTARLGQLLDDGIHESQALVYYPYEQEASLLVEGTYWYPEEARQIKESFHRIHEALLSAQVDFDFINQECLVNYPCANGQILTTCGERPTSIIFPAIPFVDEAVAEWIKAALAAGVRVIVDGERKEIKGLEGVNVEFTAESGLPTSWDLQVENEPLVTVFHRRSDDQDVYLVVNTGKTSISKEASIPAKAGELVVLDLDQGTETALPSRVDGGRRYFTLELPAGEARVIVRS